MIQTYKKGKAISNMIWAAFSRALGRSKIYLLERDPDPSVKATLCYGGFLGTATVRSPEYSLLLSLENTCRVVLSSGCGFRVRARVSRGTYRKSFLYPILISLI